MRSLQCEHSEAAAAALRSLQCEHSEAAAATEDSEV